MSALQDLAESYVLGLLDPAEAEAVEARIASPRAGEDGGEDRELARAVGAARDQLLPLDLTARDLPLGPDAWERLEAALDTAPAAGEAFGAPRPEAADRPAPRPPMPMPAPVSTSGRGRGWRLAALASMAAAALLAAGLTWQVFLAPDPAVLVVLVDDGGEPVAVLEAYADNRVVVTPLSGVEAGPTQVMQLWTKPDPDGPPVSVGLLRTVARMAVRNPDLPAPAAGQLYEITLEPAGGSPTGLPTGPVVGIGNARIPVLNEG